MASKAFITLLLLSLLETLFLETYVTPSVSIFPCSDRNKSCSSLLYQHNNLQVEQIVTYYSVNESQISPFSQGNKGDFLISVSCSCKEVNGTNGVTVGYFYDTNYRVLPHDIFINVSSQIYSGQAWPVGGEETFYKPAKVVPVHILCGCIESDSEVVVTYTVEKNDTVSDIAIRLSTTIDRIESLNKQASNSGIIHVDEVLFVPTEKKRISSPGAVDPGPAKKRHNLATILGISIALALLSLCTAAIIIVRRYKNNKTPEDPKQLPKTLTIHSLKSSHLDDIPMFESDRPIVYSLEEIEEATGNFDKRRKIGEGGFGCVYFGVLGEQEVAIKKMRSNKSKEFFAELKVLCKVHHINVVELLGYASGDDHLYLVYEFIPNGSLGDHLHDPLVKGNQPLSWTARAQIALDAAKGIEYIHDHTKTRCVHRDIKTTNILLDQGLRAKVADFGLAKLVGRTNENDFIATRLVGTPGYLPPESVNELQVTVKTDVFAFGVVLAELLTGFRALIRDKCEATKTKSLITIISNIFKEEDPESALEHVIDSNLRGSYPMEHAFKMAEIAEWCLSEDPLNRPEMREVVVALSGIVASSMEWEASLGGDSHVFSGVFTGR